MATPPPTPPPPDEKGVWKIPRSRCPQCGCTRTAIGEINDDPNATPPKPGSPIICMRCAAVTTVDEHGNPAGWTEAQMQALLEDTETMDEIAKQTERIHSFNRAMKMN